MTALQIDPLVSMAEMISDASDVSPRYSRASHFGFIAKADRCFTDDLEFPFNRGDCHRVGAEGLEMHSGGELLDPLDGVKNV